jgi:hypothetical protein
MKTPTICFLTLGLALGTTPAAHASLHGYVGEAHSSGGTLLYEEHHLVRGENGKPEQRLVTYRCPDGTAFGRKEVNYGDPLFAPSFSMEDIRFGYSEGFTREGKGGSAFVKAGNSAEKESESIKAGSSLVVDAGFDEFVRANWDGLQKNNAISLQFLVPSRLAAYKFKLSKVREETLFGEPASVYQLALTGLFGWFADEIEVAYRNSDKRLMGFEGLTNIRETLDSNIVAKISFPPKREAPSPEDGAWDVASSEVLTSCKLGA